MDDFLPIDISPYLVSSNILLSILIFITTKDALKPPFKISNSRLTITLLLLTIYCLFSFWGHDWYYYFRDYKDLVQGYTGHIENVYVWIAQNLSFDYISFRFVIWCGALFLFWDIIKRISISKSLALFIFGTIYIIWFSYARVTLAMMLAFWGLIYLSNSKINKFISVPIGLIVIVSSYFFHKSALFGIAMVLMTIIALYKPKLIFFTSIIMFPILVIVVNAQIADFLLINVESDSEIMTNYMTSGQRYLDRDVVHRGWGSNISTILERTPYYLVSFLGIKMINSKLFIPKDVKPIVILQFLIVLFSSVFLFVRDANVIIISERLMRFAVVPTSIVMAYLYQSGINRKIVMSSIYIGIGGTLYALLYSCYLASTIS